MKFRMHNKGQIICQVFTKVLERKRSATLLMQPLALMKWCKRTAWQMAELCSSATSYPLTSLQPSFSIPCTKNHPQTKYILECQTPKKDGKCTLYNAKHGVCLNSVSHRKFYSYWRNYTEQLKKNILLKLITSWKGDMTFFNIL